MAIVVALQEHAEVKKGKTYNEIAMASKAMRKRREGNTRNTNGFAKPWEEAMGREGNNTFDNSDFVQPCGREGKTIPVKTVAL